MAIFQVDKQGTSWKNASGTSGSGEIRIERIGTLDNPRLTLLHFYESTAASQPPLLCRIGNVGVTKMEKGAQAMFIRGTFVLQFRAS